MKKILILFLTVTIAAGMFFACQKKDVAAGPDNSLQIILDKGKFVMGLDDSFPPMGYRNEANEIVGYDVDLAGEVAARMGVELVLQPIVWAAKEQELNTGEIDCIWNGFTINDDRKKNVQFTPAYVRNAQVVLVKGNSPVLTLADLTGKTVGTQEGSSSVDAIDENPDFKASLKEVIGYPDFLMALMDLDVGGIDAVVIDLIVALDNMARYGKNFRILEEDLGDEEMGIGFRLKDKALADKVWETLLDMVEDGTVAGITAKWMGADTVTPLMEYSR